MARRSVNTYLADLGVALVLAALLWGFAIAAGVFQP